MASTTRNRTGCWTCRSRKVKCDETRPVCHRCNRINAPCAYGIRLTWQEESISKGICHGRSGVQRQREWQKSRAQHSSSTPTPEFIIKDGKNIQWNCTGRRMAFLNTTVQDMEVFFEFERSAENFRNDPRKGVTAFLQMQSNTPSGGYNTGIHDLSLYSTVGSSLVDFQTSDGDAFLLSYYETVICSSSTLLDNAHYNPYRHIILPMAMLSEGMYHGTMAVSAQTLGLSQPRYRVAALKHGQRATRHLIRALQRRSHTQVEVDEVLGLSLLLCWYEITDGSRPSWLTHLHGIRAIIDRYRQPSRLDTRGPILRRFLNRYFAFHLVLARTAFHVDDELPRAKCFKESKSHGEVLPFANMEPMSRSSNDLTLYMPLDELHEIDPYMGFSNSLLLLINEVAELAGRSRTSATEFHEADFHAKVSRLKSSLEKLQQLPPSHLEPDFEMASAQKKASSVISECMDIAEVNRLGALLFLHEACSHSSTGGDSGSNTAKPWLSEDDKNSYVHDILETVHKNLSSMIRTAALPLWPLFLAGCCCKTDEDRMTVMDIFQQSERPQRFGNIQPAREVVEMVWRQHDLSIQDDRKRRRTAANARPAIQPCERFVWEHAMKKLGGWKLSLT